jgi:hypothetical protein
MSGFGWKLRFGGCGFQDLLCNLSFRDLDFRDLGFRIWMEILVSGMWFSGFASQFKYQGFGCQDVDGILGFRDFDVRIWREN